MTSSISSTCETTNTRPKSKKCFENLCEVIPGGTNSPVRAFKGLGLNPMIVDRGTEDLIYDIDGNEYIDFCGSWGPLILGHAHPEVVKVAQERTAKGSTFGITTAVEEKLARIIIKNVPSVEKIRFVSSGTEATMSAVRLARGFTKKDVIVKFSGHYHGHADYFLVHAGSGVLGMNPSSTSSGIPDDIVKNTVCLNFNDVEGTRQFLEHADNKDRIAAVILEPIAGNMGCVPSSIEFMNMLRAVTKNIGALLIFDEVITGFRVGLKGAQELYGISADLTCFGKIIGGGFPAAAFGGKREIMDFLAPIGTVYQAGTLSGNPVAMEAGLKTLQLLEGEGVYDLLKSKADIITLPLNQYFDKYGINACIQQVGSMFTIFFGRRSVSNMEEAKKCDFEEFARFFRFLFNRGIYIPPMQVEAWFVSLAHTKEHLEKTRDLILEFFENQRHQ